MTVAAATESNPINPLSFDSQHEDLIHDAQTDYYGRLLATASSDKTVKIFQVEPNQSQKLVATLSGHEGPVWQVAWAHPKFGSILATCSYDGHVFIWKDNGAAGWQKIKDHHAHESSVNSIAWCPAEHGLQLACGSSDGKISILSYLVEGRDWESKEWTAHQIGCNAVTWCPSAKPDSLLAPTTEEVPSYAPLRLASGGCDNLVKVWIFEGNEGGWKLENELNGHADWVRDVVWRPNLGTPQHYIVSCSQDRTVLVWKSPDGSKDSWTMNPLVKNPETQTFSDTLWRVQFSPAGNILAVAGGDNHISMWQELPSGQWECLSNVDQSTLASSSK